MKCPKRRKCMYLSSSKRFTGILGRINDLLCSCLGDLVSQHVSDPTIKTENRHELIGHQRLHLLPYSSISKNFQKASHMVQQAKVHEDLSLITGNHIVQGKRSNSHKCLPDFHMAIVGHAGLCALTRK